MMDLRAGVVMLAVVASVLGACSNRKLGFRTIPRPAARDASADAPDSGTADDAGSPDDAAVAAVDAAGTTVDAAPSTDAPDGAISFSACRGLECQQTTCTNGCPPCSRYPCLPPVPSCRRIGCLEPQCPVGRYSSVSGVVFDPAGKVPLYNAMVYVTNAALDPLPEGRVCEGCGALPWSSILAATITDTRGRFTLQDVPVGDDIPVTIQVGRWRRQVVLPHVAACVDTPFPDGTFRLPRNQGEGHLPRIALTTGAGDALECFLRKIGIDESEFTPEGGTGRVNLFSGEGGTDRYGAALNGGAPFTPAPTWWESLANLSVYDVILHSCDDTENPTNKTLAARQALRDYADGGGRVFATHWQNDWVEHGADPLPGAARFDHRSDPPSPFIASVDLSFPKGWALSEWLVNVGASTTTGQLEVREGHATISAATPGQSRSWVVGAAPPSVQYLSIDTPVDADDSLRCGRIVLSDAHVSADDSSSADRPFPSGCTTSDLSPQEKAFEFLFFDASSCVRSDGNKGPPP